MRGHADWRLSPQYYNAGNSHMDFNEGKAALKNGYLKAGLELVDEHQVELNFKYGREQFRISQGEILEAVC